MRLCRGDFMSYQITRIKHAAHTGPNSGWDLEQIIVKSELRPSISAMDLPPGFEYHSGFRDASKAQHWIFYRRAEFSPDRCPNCPEVES